jgi:hypothetical protein
MDESRQRIGDAIRNAVSTTVELYNENFVLSNTSPDKIKNLRNLYRAARRGEIRWKAVYNAMTRIYNENKNQIDPEACERCFKLYHLHDTIRSTLDDMKALERSATIESGFGHIMEELPIRTGKWLFVTVKPIPDRPEFNYYYSPRQMLAVFEQPKNFSSGIVWDDMNGGFFKADGAFHLFPLDPEDKVFSYEPSQAGFIINKVTGYLDEFDRSFSDEQQQLHALDKVFIMLFAYFDLIGYDLVIQDIITADDQQLLNQFCALLHGDESMKAIAGEEGLTVETFSALSLVQKWYHLALMITRSLYDPAILQNVASTLRAWKANKNASQCTGLSGGKGGGLLESLFKLFT